jgi:hypothetical protein
MQMLQRKLTRLLKSKVECKENYLTYCMDFAHSHDLKSAQTGAASQDLPLAHSTTTYGI